MTFRTKVLIRWIFFSSEYSASFDSVSEKENLAGETTSSDSGRRRKLTKVNAPVTSKNSRLRKKMERKYDTFHKKKPFLK